MLRTSSRVTADSHMAPNPKFSQAFPGPSQDLLAQGFSVSFAFAFRLNKKEFTLEEIYTNKNYQSPTARR